jgi:hypothetical protein
MTPALAGVEMVGVDVPQAVSSAVATAAAANVALIFFIAH